MRSHVLPLGLAAILFSPLLAQAQADARLELSPPALFIGTPLVLSRALALAERADAVLRLKQAEINAADGVVENARAPFNSNPEV